MRILFIFLLLSFATNLIFAQEDQKQIWHEQGNKFLDKSHELIANLDSCIFYTQLAQTYYEKSESWDKYVECFSGLSTVYYWKGDLEQYKFNFDQALSAAHKYLDKKDKSYGYVLINSSIFYSRKGDFKTWIATLKEALSIIQQADSLDQFIPFAYQNLGKAYWQKKDHLEALKYFQKSISSRKKRGDHTSNYYLSDLFDIAKCYAIIEQSDSALHLFRSGINELDRIPQKEQHLIEQFKINGFHNIAETFLKLNLADSAFVYIKKALALQTDDKAHHKAASYELMAKYYLRINAPQQALKSIHKSTEIFSIKNPKHPKHENLATNHRIMAEAYFQLEQYDQALKSYQTALQKIAFSFESNDPSENPFPKDLISKGETLNILKGKAAVLMKLGEKGFSQINALEQAFKCHQLSKTLIKALRIELLAKGSKYILAEKATPIYEQAIENALRLYELTQVDKYLIDAFNSAENNKAILLLESLTNEIAKKSAGIPDSLLAQEYNLTLDIAFIEKSINEEKLLKSKANINNIERWQNQFFDLQNNYQNLITKLEKEYPNYYQVKYADGTIGISAIQESIDDQAVLLSYFVGEKNSYVFKIEKNSAAITKLNSNQSINRSIIDLQAVVNKEPDYQTAQEDYLTFTKNAQKLHKILIKPFISNAINKQTLVIIPDGILSYLPFELLITNTQIPKNVNYSASSLSYLINNYTISYDYSASLWYTNKQTQKQSDLATFAGFAPSFSSALVQGNRSCSNTELYNLECSIQEVSGIQEIVGGTIFTGKEATRKSFQENASHYQILHLATHACIDQNNSMLHKIHLTDDYLSNYDLSTLKLNAELAVLSACNTGSGQIQKGEGIMSLARTFTESGCKSTILSLWPVNDCATSTIMTELYRNFSEGEEKNAALRLAKLSYLSTAKKFESHPYFWAAFVQFGNSEALDLARNHFQLWPFFCLGLIILLPFAFLKFRKKRLD